MKNNKGFGKKHPSKIEKNKVISSYEKGKSVTDLSEIFSVHPMTIYRWLRESKVKKFNNFSRSQSPGSGRPCKLDEKVGKKLLKLLKKPATKFGFETILWNTKRIQILCKKEFGLKVSHMVVWRFLNKMDYSCKKVQKIYKEGDKNKKDEWLIKTIPKIKRVVRKHNAILYFEDESNIKLSPVMGTSWSPKGERINAIVTGKRGSIAAISAVSNDGRLIFSLHDSGKRFNSDDIINFLMEMLNHHNRRHLVVVMDQAPCHRSKKVKAYIQSQKRLHVFYLPSYSPEYNPDEQVWNHLKNVELKNHEKTNTKDLKKLTRSKLKKMAKSKNTIKAIFKRCENSSLYEY